MSGPFQLRSILHSINRVISHHPAGVRYPRHSRGEKQNKNNNNPLITLTHQRAESHHGEQPLQKNPEGIHQGAVLAAPGVRALRRAGGHRRVGEGAGGTQRCSTLTRQCHVPEVGEHVDATNSIHGTELGFYKQKTELRVGAQSSPADVGQLIDTLSRTVLGKRWRHPLTSRHTIILLQASTQPWLFVQKEKSLRKAQRRRSSRLRAL